MAIKLFPWQHQYRKTIKKLTNAELLQEVFDMIYADGEQSSPTANWQAHEAKEMLVQRLHRSWFFELDGKIYG